MKWNRKSKCRQLKHTQKNDMANFMEYKLENLTDMIDQPDDGGWWNGWKLGEKNPHNTKKGKNLY